MTQDAGYSNFVIIMAINVEWCQVTQRISDGW